MDAILDKDQPQQGMPPKQGRPYGRQQNRPERKVSQVSLEQYLQNWQQFIANEQDKTRKLCEMSITIHRRARALTIDDQCGRYGIRPGTSGRWLDYDPDLDGEIHPINIVGPAINTNQNACLQSNSATLISSANQNAQNKQNAMRWQRVADYFERTGWDEAERAFIFDAVQKDGTVLIHSCKEKVDKQTVAQVREKKMGLAVYQCPCGASGLTQTSDTDDGPQQIQCPHCGGQANGVVTNLEGFDLEEQEVPTYKIVSEVIPFYNFTIDTYGAKIKGIAGAKWLQIQRLVDRMELETKYPGIEFGGPSGWSYALRCDYALANGAWDQLNSSNVSGQRTEFQKFEERSIYLHSDAYSNWVCPEDYEFVNAKGKKTFVIKTGETIEEAWQAQYGYRPNGFKFVWIDDRLIDICSPNEETLNFRECFTDVHWRRDSGSYLSSPNYSIVTIQDDITLLNTQNHNIIARNAVKQVYFDSLIFDKEDFAQDYVGTKNAHLLGEDRNLTGSVIELPVPTPNPALGNQLQFLWSIKDDVTNVTPAMRGDAQTQETLGAVRQQLEQSYGSLTSVLKSFAQCKNTAFVQKAKIAKEHWTVEQFQAIGSMFGEPWSEDDVAAMCDVDLEEDLLVTYKTGSEMPQSNLDREMRFAQGINALLPFIEAGVPISPDKYQKILAKIDEQAGFDFDLTGLETNEIIAQKRYLDLADLCLQAGELTFEQIEQAKQTIVTLDPMTGMPITALDLVTEQIFAQSQIRFSQYEDLEQQKGFYVEQLRAETGKSKPNYLLLEMMHVILAAIDEVMAQMAMQAMMADPAYQAEQAAAADEKASADEAAMRDAEKVEGDRAAQAESQELGLMGELMKQGADQDHQLEMAKVQGDIARKNEAAKPKPKGK